MEAPSLAEMLTAAPAPGEPDRMLPGTFDTEEEVNNYREEVERALVERGMQEWWCIDARGVTVSSEFRGGAPQWVYALWLHAYTDEELADLAADREFLANGGSYEHALRPPAGRDPPGVLGVVRRTVAIEGLL